MPRRLSLTVKGIVQGVGFRPFVYSLAHALNLSGWVKNAASGVFIEVEGPEADLEQFCRFLTEQAPPLARIDSVSQAELPCQGSANFVILPSDPGEKDTLIAPDMAVCPECLADMRDPQNRRYRYPFTNCTNCGPRFTIIAGLPYDRPLTTMRDFAMCASCAAEYKDPCDRRFHAQPNACPVCGPQMSFYDHECGPVRGDEVWPLAQKALKDGQILAVKGLGGYHLVCDAQNEQAVLTLRRRKYRWDKPFAVMMPDIDTVRRFCQLNDDEEVLLDSRRRPIVLLQKKNEQDLAFEVAPHNARLGVMLPYTPMHYLLLEHQTALVMTSGNVSDEPIVYEDGEAFMRLWRIADCFLIHDRPIFRRCDDSVAVFAAGKSRIIRRSRGYAPEPLPINTRKNILACGGEQKNTFCLTKDNKAFLSQHIGDLENLATLESFEKEIAYFQKMFTVNPQIIAHDLHPEYLSTKYALDYQGKVKTLGVQHHHAHLASVLAEAGRDYETAIGLIFDGTGYGTDGNLWGGEVLVGNAASYRRAAHLDYVPMPGGAKAIREPWRMAMSYLASAIGSEGVAELPLAKDFPDNWPLLWQTAQKGINAPLTSGMGRLFDAVAACCGIGQKVNYEGQAAIELEQAIIPQTDGAYKFLIKKESASDDYLIDWRPVFASLIEDLAASQNAGLIAWRFHEAVIGLALDISLLLREKLAINTVALSGGVWQNIYLMEGTVKVLTEAGFEVLSNAKVPTNDGGISYGQAAVAAADCNL